MFIVVFLYFSVAILALEPNAPHSTKKSYALIFIAGFAFGLHGYLSLWWVS